jgi:nucleoside-diphosphate-sugar epimerase
LHPRSRFRGRPDLKKRKPDIAKARALLGWEARVTLEESLRETVTYFRGIVAAVA